MTRHSSIAFVVEGLQFSTCFEEQLRCREVGDTTTSLFPARIHRTTDRLRWIGRTRMDEHRPRHEQTRHFLTSIDQDPSPRRCEQASMALTHGSTRSGRPRAVIGCPRIEPDLQVGVITAVPIDHCDRIGTSGSLTGSAHDVKLVASPLACRFLGDKTDPLGGRCGARTHDLHGVNVAL
jgi:hypothetical protein